MKTYLPKFLETCQKFQESNTAKFRQNTRQHFHLIPKDTK